MILAADPGSEKTGMAVVEEDGSLVIKKVIRTKEFEKEAEDLLSSHPVSAFIMGNGTHHKEIQKRADAVLEKMGLPFRTILESTRRKWESSGTGRIILPKAFPVSSPKACGQSRFRLTIMWPGSSAAFTLGK